MIQGRNTNKVYLSERLHSDSLFSKTSANLIQVLDKHQISYGLLKSTKDIWCRDYMPLQVGKSKFVQFRYEPSYLEDESSIRSDPK
ncbi:MAG TPA: hypothetical protein VFM79_09130, partial [Pelobium sp.]|nr:hypothetical protein [Pelobium sp.]